MTDTVSTADLGFEPQLREIAVDDLPVQGELPPWLSGSLLRTGPGLWEAGKTRLRHWFDGFAMLHRFTFSAGRVSYANRFLNSAAYRAAREGNEIAFQEFATDPCRTIFQRVHSAFSGQPTDNGNVNIGRLGDRFLAMTETPIPVEFDRRTLDAAGVAYQAPGQLSTAHPHRDRATGAMLNYAAKLGPRSSYRFFRVDGDTVRPEVIATIPVREPAYMHSFGLTESWLVLAEFPLVVNPAKLALSGKPFIENYRWKPDRGTRFTLIDRHTGKIGATLTADACFAFHHVNAYEDGTEVVVDVCAYQDPRIIQDFYLDRLRGLLGDSDSGVSRSHLTRFRLCPADARITTERLSDIPLELPRINSARCQERDYRYVWGVGYDQGWFDRIVKVDVVEREAITWRESSCHPGEPVFVARPGAEREDDGVVLSVVLDGRRRTSFLLVLEAGTLRELARADVGQHIPHGIHGGFTSQEREPNR